MQQTFANDAELRGLLMRSQRSAKRRAQPASSAHLLLTMLQVDAEVGSLLQQAGIDEGSLLERLREVVEESPNTLSLAIGRAERLALSHGQEGSRALHLLSVLLRDRHCSAYRCLQSLADLTKLEAALAKALPSKRELHAQPVRLPVERQPSRRLLTMLRPPVTRPPLATRPAAHGWELDAKRFPTLHGLGRNLCMAALGGELEPTVGRQAEIDRLLEVLARRQAHNPLLVGPSGIGKTALVHALAARLVGAPNLRQPLPATIMLEVSLGSFIGGTGVRGALAQRFALLRQELSHCQAHVVFCIDDIQTCFGMQEGPDEVGTELKALLSLGHVSCIATADERQERRCIERDAGFAKLFTRIRLEEPALSLSQQIVDQAAVAYAAHHAVAIDPAACRAAVEMTARHWPARRLPEKALTILDMAAARRRRLPGNEAEPHVDRRLVAEVLAEQIGIPAERLLEQDGERLLRLESLLGERIVGHRAALARIAACLRSAFTGLRAHRPTGVFLLLGPTGVGKTETAKAIAEVLFPGGAMTRFDMSAFSEAHTVARLFGAPPGYIGHEQGGQLTEAVRSRPYQVLLLDEVEKAHPQVWLSLLSIFDEGIIADSQGRTVDFTRTVILLTSNLGAAYLTSSAPIGFAADEAMNDADRQALQELAIAQAARRSLPPELWGRLDETLVYLPLSRAEVRAIAVQLLEQLAARLEAARHIQLCWHPEVIDRLLEAGGYQPDLGARPLRRVIRRLVEAPLAEALLAGRVVRGSEVHCRLVDGEIDLAAL